MIYCPFCDTANRSGSKFCNECGAPLGEQAVVCSHCLSPNPPVNRFCRTCGYALPESASLATEAWQPAIAADEGWELGDELPSLEADVPSVDAPGRGTAPPCPYQAAVSGSLESDCVTPPEGPAIPFNPFRKSVDSDAPSVSRRLPDWLFMSERTARPLPDWLDLEDGPSPDFLLPDWPETLQPSKPRVFPSWLLLPEESPLPPRGGTAAPCPHEAAVNGFPESDYAEASAIPFNPFPETVVSSVPAAPRLLPAWLFLPEGSEQIVKTLPDWLDLDDGAEAPRRHLPDWLEIPEPILPPWLFAVEETALPPLTTRILPGWLFLTDPVGELARQPSPRPAGSQAAADQTLHVLQFSPSPSLPLRTSLAPGPEAPSAPSNEEACSNIPQPQAEVTAPVSLSGRPRRFRLISVLLVAVVTLPLFLPMGINVEPRQETSRVFDSVEALPPSANVLVAFDWSPGSDEEMAPIAEALVRHLVKRKARIVAVSLTPEGGKLAQRSLDQALLGAIGYKYGRQVVNLGYRPGGEAAIRGMLVDLPQTYGVDHFGIPVRDLPLLGEVRSLKGADLIVVLAAEPEALVSWVTQVSAAYQGIRMVAGVSAAALPWAQPFAPASQAAQLKGILVGIRGAAEYELATGESRLGIAATDAQSLGAVFLALVIVFGNLAYLRARASHPRSVRASEPSPFRR